MRIKLVYESLDDKDIILPCHYNYVIQSLIYNTFSLKTAQRLHEEGFLYEKRKFKLFTFSRILEKGDLIINKNNKSYLKFKRKITIYFSSPIDDIVIDLAQRGFREREFTLLGKKVCISQLEIISLPKIKEKIKIRFLSPVTIYSTFEKKNSKKFIHYYKPFEREFSDLIKKNALKKYQLICGEKAENLDLSIVPYKFSLKENLKIIYFKNTPIECYTGVYELTGSPELIYLTYETGLGNKNSAGFGMWEIWRGKESDEDA